MQVMFKLSRALFVRVLVGFFFRTGLALTVLSVVVVRPTYADTFEMDFPFRLDNREVAQMPASLDGFTLTSISASVFKQNLNKQLSTSVNAWLTEQGDNAITVEQFKARGIHLTLSTQDMLIALKLDESAMATDSLTYAQKKHVVLPENAASWSLLNNFNLKHQRSNNNDSYDSQFEWLFAGNVGGGEAVNFNGSVFWDHHDTTNSQAYRGDLSLFYDEPTKPLRFTFGDTQSRVTGHLSSYQLGGISVSKAYAQLQPQRNLTPGNSQVFMLDRPASLEIFVNDFMISRIRLRPGRYDVNDLPLTSGSNNISIVATYADGKTDQFKFTTHYNAQLLSQGLNDYTVAFGLPSSVVGNVYHYDANWLFSGAYEYGVSDVLTLGANGVAQSRGVVAGLAATMGKSWGNVAFRFSASGGQVNSGQAFTIDTEHSVFGQSGSGSPNLRLGYEKKHGFTPSPWLENRNTSTTQRLYYDYSFYLNDNIDFNTSGSVLLNANNQQTNDFTVQANWRGQGLNISAGYSRGITSDVVDTDQQRYFLNFSWSLYDRRNNSRQRVSYSSRTQIVGASHNKVNSNYLGDYGYQLLAERGADHRREQVRGSYTHQFFRADFDADNTNRDTQLARSNASINLSTSLGFADGKVGIGTNITAPFALIEKHQSLEDVDVFINVNRKGLAQGKSGNNFAALINLGSGYSIAQFAVDVPDAPFGYDWGPGTYRVAGGANTGHNFEVGSALSYTVLGVLTNDKGEPMSLKRGMVIQIDAVPQPPIKGQEQGQRKVFFTNRAGRFVLEGVGAGEFILQIKGREGHFTIAESEQRFVDVGTIILLHPINSTKGDKL